GVVVGRPGDVPERGRAIFPKRGRRVGREVLLVEEAARDVQHEVAGGIQVRVDEGRQRLEHLALAAVLGYHRIWGVQVDQIVAWLVLEQGAAPPGRRGKGIAPHDLDARVQLERCHVFAQYL